MKVLLVLALSLLVLSAQHSGVHAQCGAATLIQTTKTVADSGVALKAAGEVAIQTFQPTCTGYVKSISVELVSAVASAAGQMTAGSNTQVDVAAVAAGMVHTFTFTAPAAGALYTKQIAVVTLNVPSKWSLIADANTANAGNVPAGAELTGPFKGTINNVDLTGNDFVTKITLDPLPMQDVTNIDPGKVMVQDCPDPAGGAVDLAKRTCFQTLPGLITPSVVPAAAKSGIYTVQSGASPTTTTVGVVVNSGKGTFTVTQQSRNVDDAVLGANCINVPPLGYCEVKLQFVGDATHKNPLVHADTKATLTITSKAAGQADLAKTIIVFGQTRFPVYKVGAVNVAPPANFQTAPLTIDLNNGLLFKHAVGCAAFPAAAADPYQIKLVNPLQPGHPEMLTTTVAAPGAPLTQFALNGCTNYAGAAECAAPYGVAMVGNVAKIENVNIVLVTKFNGAPVAAPTHQATYSVRIETVAPTFDAPIAPVPTAFGEPLFYNIALDKTVSRPTELSIKNNALRCDLSVSAATFVKTPAADTATIAVDPAAVAVVTPGNTQTYKVDAKAGIKQGQTDFTITFTVATIAYVHNARIVSTAMTITPNDVPAGFPNDASNPFFFTQQKGFPSISRAIYTIANPAIEGTARYTIPTLANPQITPAPAGAQVAGKFTLTTVAGCGVPSPAANPTELILSPGQSCQTIATFTPGTYPHNVQHAKFDFKFPSDCAACGALAENQNMKLFVKGQTTEPKFTVGPATGSTLTFAATEFRTTSPAIDIVVTETSDLILFPGTVTQKAFKVPPNTQLQISQPVIAGANPEDFEICAPEEFPLVVPATQERIISVCYHPVGYRGPSAATLTMTPNAGTQPITYVLKGVNDDGPARPTVSISQTGKFDCAGDTAILTATPVGGFPPYKFQWQVGGANVPANGNDIKFNVAAAAPGVYTVVITDELGTAATSNQITLAAQVAAPTITFGVAPANMLKAPSCKSRTDGQFKFTVAPCDATQQFLWRSPCAQAGPLCSLQTYTDSAGAQKQSLLSIPAPPLFTCPGRRDLQAGVHTLQVVYNNGKCQTAQFGVTISDAASPVVPACPPEEYFAQDCIVC